MTQTIITRWYMMSLRVFNRLWQMNSLPHTSPKLAGNFNVSRGVTQGNSNICPNQAKNFIIYQSCISYKMHLDVRCKMLLSCGINICTNLFLITCVIKPQIILHRFQLTIQRLLSDFCPFVAIKIYIGLVIRLIIIIFGLIIIIFGQISCDLTFRGTGMRVNN